MECAEARERIAECLDGEPPAGGELGAHLAACASCREELARVRRAYDVAARAVADFEPSPASWERLSGEMAAIGRDWERQAAFRRRLAVAAAFAAPVLAALAWLLLSR